MVMVIFPQGAKVRYDLGGVLFGSFETLEDLFEFLHALKDNGNKFMIQVPIVNSENGSCDTEGIINVGRIYQFLCSAKLPCHLMYEDSAFRPR